MPPVPVKSSVLPLEEPDRTFLDDISNELLMLMRQRPPHELESHVENLSAESASPGLSYLLGSMDCEESFSWIPRKVLIAVVRFKNTQY